MYRRDPSRVIDSPAQLCQASALTTEVSVQNGDDLPQAYREARAADEPFWQTQEKRIQGATGQPCCSLSGISSGLIAMDGNFAVIIHGEDECAACFLHYGPSSWRFFCTGLTERHFVTGETAAPLRACLERVCEEVQPDAVFVLGACPVEVIGDRFETVVADVGRQFPDIPMSAMHTSGLKVGSQAAMADWMYATLVDLPMLPPVDRGWRERVQARGMALVDAAVHADPAEILRLAQQAQDERSPPALVREDCVAFLGLPSPDDLGGYRAEWEDVLPEVGLTITGRYPYGASLDDWRAATFPAVVFVVDRSLYPKTVKALERGGTSVVNVPLPVGTRATETFYRVIGEATGRTEHLQTMLQTRRDAAQDALRVASERFAGLRMAMGLRMLNNYRADQLAQQGLGDFDALDEMGFRLTVMVQGPPEKKDKFARIFELHGVDVPFEVFPEPWNLSEHLGGDRFDIAYLADHCRGEARKAGVPMIVSRLLYPGYEGVAKNCAAIGATLDRLL